MPEQIKHFYPGPTPHHIDPKDRDLDLYTALTDMLREKLHITLTRKEVKMLLHEQIYKSGKNYALRGRGITTQQMKDAPQHAFFVWCNELGHIAQDLAKKAEREDLRIITPGDLTEFRIDRFRGWHNATVVFDHACDQRALEQAIYWLNAHGFTVRLFVEKEE